jgi:hypothetical protein
MKLDQRLLPSRSFARRGYDPSKAPVEPPVHEREFDGNVEASPNGGAERAPCPLPGGQALENAHNGNG